MMKAILHYTLFLGLCLSSSFCLAQSQPKLKPIIVPKGYMALSCPSPQSLTLDPDSQTWSKKPYWKSFSMSFSKNLKSFNGAQWTGVNVGQIICIYSPADTSELPVMLYFKSISNEPNAQLWSKNQGDYKNCVSDDPNKCQFLVKLKPKKTLDIYKEAESLRQNAKDNELNIPRE